MGAERYADLKGDALCQSRGPGGLGPEHQGAGCISIGSWTRYGQEPFPGRRLWATPITAQQQDVTDAIQVMRQKAQQAGTLESTPQQTVTTQDSSIVIEPARIQGLFTSPSMIPGWFTDTRSVMRGRDGTHIPESGMEEYHTSRSDLASGIGFFGGFGVGLGVTGGFDWHNHYPIFNRDRYYSKSRTFYNRDAFSPRSRGLN